MGKLNAQNHEFGEEEMPQMGEEVLMLYYKVIANATKHPFRYGGLVKQNTALHIGVHT